MLIPSTTVHCMQEPGLPSSVMIINMIMYVCIPYKTNFGEIVQKTLWWINIVGYHTHAYIYYARNIGGFKDWQF